MRMRWLEGGALQNVVGVKEDASSQTLDRNKPESAIFVTSSDTCSGVNRPSGLYQRDNHRIIPSKLKVAAVTSKSRSFPRSFNCVSASLIKSTYERFL